jgi:hypothetical protein
MIEYDNTTMAVGETLVMLSLSMLKNLTDTLPSSLTNYTITNDQTLCVGM